MSYNDSSFDIIVAGGGLSGVAAAVAASREGSEVLLIERYGFLGGMATAGLVNPFMPYCIRPGTCELDLDNIINAGIFKEILGSLSDLNGLHANSHTFNEELLKIVLDRMLRNKGVKVLFHSFITGLGKSGNRIEYVRTAGKSGNVEYKARYFVDATGDADLSALAGCEYSVGRDGDGLCQPMTLCFRLANVDRSKYDRDKCRRFVNEKYMEMKQKGLIRNPREDVLVFEHMVEDVIHFNSTRVIRKSALNAEEISQAEMEAREQVMELYCFMKENIPGFENSRLLMTAPQIGIRESRRVAGHYTVTAEDLLGARKFEDSTARGTYPVDIHNPSGGGTVIKEIPHGDYYTIPYRALVPKGIDNLIVAGRPVSSTHEAHSALRVMPICACMGEAAGTAASVAVKENIPFMEVDIKKLHSLLDEHGALY